MASFKPRRSNFKYPKPLVESNNNNSRLLSPRRPQPSPSKRELMMQELGLDEHNGDIASDSSDSVTFSDDDDITQQIGGVSQAEYDALQKDRDSLLIRNKQLEDTLRHCQSQLHREETRRTRHVKILKKAQTEITKDKDKLIMNLEDIVFDTEQKIKRLEDDLKGNPIKPTIEIKPQVSSYQKLIDTVKTLHSDKSSLGEQIVNLEQELAEKSIEVLTLKENPSPSSQAIKHEHSRTDSEKVAEKLKMEIRGLKETLAERERDLIAEREKFNSASDKMDRLETKIHKLESDGKKNDKKARMEIENLRKELELKIEEIYDLESRPPEVVTKTIEKVVEVESSEQKSEISEAQEKVQKLNAALNDAERSSKKAKNEITRLREQVAKYQSELSDVRMESDDLKSAHLQEESRLQAELKEFEAQLDAKRKSLESVKKNLDGEKAKVSDLERELQELKASSKRSRDEFMFEIETQKRKMRDQQEDLNQELREANDAAESQKLEADKAVERLENKILKIEEKLRKSKENCENLTSKLDSKVQQLESMSDDIDSKEDIIRSLRSKITDVEAVMEKEKQKSSAVQQKLITANAVNETLQNQLKDLSGASDVATVELSGLRGENSTLKIELNQTKVSNEKYLEDLKKAELGMVKIREQMRAMEKTVNSDKATHQKELQSLKESHSVAVAKMKTSADSELHAVKSKLFKFQCSLRQVLSSVHILVKENQHLKKECSKFPDLIEDSLMQAEKKINDALAEINENSKELIRRYKKEMQLRKKYHNELVELKGNIRVFGRVRPTISEDGSGAQAKIAVTYDRDDDGLMYVHNSQRGRSMLFELDKVFQPGSTQLQVYSEVQALVTSCIDGYHVCIFAYGQTGSGKTYTMEGPPTDPGINQRALRDLFSEVEEKSRDWDYEVSVCLVEIYNESLKDLLTSKPSSDKLEIKMNADGSLYVPGLTCKPVKNLDEVNRLFALGRSNRATACTNMNEHSSRSHAVLMVNVKGLNLTTGVKTYGKLNLIDLAGSERVSKSGASGDRLKEAQNINKSLSALGDVIQALGAKQSHIPFRNSKLTYLLQDSLSKDSKTLMVVQVAPVEKNVSETICSLSFAQRVRKVELGQANRKVEETRDDQSSTPRKSNLPTSRSAQQGRKK